MSDIILPGSYGFDLTLATLPPNWGSVAAQTNGEFAMIAREGTGILEAVAWEEAMEYVWGGEYDEVLEAQMDYGPESDGVGEFD